VASHGDKSMLAVAVGRDLKGKLSVVLYIAAIGLSFLSQWMALCIYVMWRSCGWCPTAASKPSPRKNRPANHEGA
jgi:hypothetical protein